MRSTGSSALVSPWVVSPRHHTILVCRQHGSARGRTGTRKREGPDAPWIRRRGKGGQIRARRDQLNPTPDRRRHSLDAASLGWSKRQSGQVVLARKQRAHFRLLSNVTVSRAADPL